VIYEREKGVLKEKNVVPSRDRLGRVEWDEPFQRTYAATTGFWIDQWSPDSVYTGVAEFKLQDYETVYGYRNLINTNTKFRGGGCAARIGNKVVIGSEFEKGVTICPIPVPTN
jgi:hypothetical protein